jgi:hypothetical protein
VVEAVKGVVRKTLLTDTPLSMTGTGTMGSIVGVVLRPVERPRSTNLSQYMPLGRV